MCILIYDENHKHEAIPDDDPYDSNNDLVYILPANDFISFVGRKCTNVVSKKLIIDQFAQYPPKWNYLKLTNSPKYGYIVRSPDLDIVHGIGYSNNSIESFDTIPFTKYNTSDFNKGIRLLNKDFYLANSYSSVNAESPGLPNSASNALLINNIINCYSQFGIVEPYDNYSFKNNDNKKPDFFVYPNPSNGQFRVVIQAEDRIDSKILIYDTNGRNLFEESVSLNRGENLIELNFQKVLLPGIYHIIGKSQNKFIGRCSIVVIK